MSDAAAPVRGSLIDWTSRTVEVERDTEGDLVVTDRVWHDDALGHVMKRRASVQLRRRAAADHLGQPCCGGCGRQRGAPRSGLANCIRHY